MAQADVHRTGSRSSLPYGDETLWPVRTLQFIAIAWVVLNQFRFHLGLHAGDRFGLVFKGYLGAELFFVAGGFMACHAWMRMRAQGGRYTSLLWRRLARVYPLHLAAMVAMAALALASREAHEPYAHSMIDLAAVPANLALVQAWGVLPTVSWNFPSWLISAEWFALVALPLTVAIAFKGWRGPWTAVLAPVPLFAAAYYLAQNRGVLFSDMTAQIGALQTIPAFLFGAGLYRFAAERGVSPRMAGRIVGASAVWILVASALRLPDPLIFPAFGALVLGLAETLRSSRPLLAGPLARYLASIAYAVLLVYLLVDIVFFHAVKAVLGEPHGAAAWLALAAVFPLILAAAAAAHHLIERPAYRRLRAADPFAGIASLGEPEPAAPART